MEYFIESVISNLLVATVLSAAVLLITRVWKNPHLAHALWLIVLLKLITPPLCRVELPAWQVSDSMAVSTDVIAEATTSPSTPVELDAAEQTSNFEQSEPKFAQTNDFAAAPLREKADQNPAASIGSVVERKASRFPGNVIPRPTPAIAVFLVWMAGTFVSTCIVMLRFVRFHRLSLNTPTAPTWITELAQSLARKFEIRCPQVRMFPGRVSPMVWPVPKPTILLPMQLVDELKRDQLATIIAHELAHVRRRDHWVRYLEVVLAVSHWWNPVFWWAKRRLRTAEECCCDVLVIQTMPKLRRQYGEAILQTAEFVTKRNKSPLPATGFGVSYPLKRRIAMILSSRFERRPFSRVGNLAMACVALVVLPISAIAVPQNKPESTADESAFVPTASAGVVSVPTSAFAPSAKQSREEKIEFSAIVNPARKAHIHARLGAYVDKVLARAGDHVEKGQILVELSSDDLKNDVRRREGEYARVQALAEQANPSIDATRAALQMARAEYSKARVQLKSAANKIQTLEVLADRYQELFEQGTASQTDLLSRKLLAADARAELEVLETQIVSAKASVEKHEALIAEAKAGKNAADAKLVMAESELRAAKLRLDHTKVRAPFAGIITNADAVLGMRTAAPTSNQSKPLFVVAAVDTVSVVGVVNASLFGQINKGMPVQIAFSDGPTVTSQISRVSPVIDLGMRTIRVEIDLENREGKLRIGMDAKVTVQTGDNEK